MYKTMLVPLDGTELAESILPYAEEVAAHMVDDLHVLHVCTPGEAPFMCRSYVERAAETIKHAQGEHRNQAMPLNKDRRINIESRILVGDAAEQILLYARDSSIDFILMSSHLRSGAGRWLLGSVAYKVLAAARVPVWLVRPAAGEYLHEGTPFHILVPLDSSSSAEAVLPHVRDIARQRGTPVKVTLLRVCESPDLLSDYPEAIMSHTWDEHVRLALESTQQSCGNYLRTVEDKLDVGDASVAIEVLDGNAPQKIIEYLNANPVNLLAISTHGRTGPGPWPLGGVAEKLISASPVPLFVVRPS